MIVPRRIDKRELSLNLKYGLRSRYGLRTWWWKTIAFGSGYERRQTVFFSSLQCSSLFGCRQTSRMEYRRTKFLTCWWHSAFLWLLVLTGPWPAVCCGWIGHNRCPRNSFPALGTANGASEGAKRTRVIEERRTGTGTGSGGIRQPSTRNPAHYARTARHHHLCTRKSLAQKFIFLILKSRCF